MNLQHPPSIGRSHHVDTSLAEPPDRDPPTTRPTPGHRLQPAQTQVVDRWVNRTPAGVVDWQHLDQQGG